ncbi:MAG: hypothetical protein KGL35_16015 [Bradyrhizobium sp.]|nr:hypothetical protein [Betaproteobacteria bacterium]MDE2470205.1 hypothetical protein [Bradyrhizobium sp.]
MPKTAWRLYAGNSLAPKRRKFLGSYVPEDDTRLQNQDSLPAGEATKCLLRMLARIHNPVTWNADVERRLVDMRLGR